MNNELDFASKLQILCQKRFPRFSSRELTFRPNTFPRGSDKFFANSPSEPAWFYRQLSGSETAEEIVEEIAQLQYQPSVCGQLFQLQVCGVTDSETDATRPTNIRLHFEALCKQRCPDCETTTVVEFIPVASTPEWL